ncbi:MAG TPA: serine/threonine-protein kinase [Tepidisphaeraceae bacterium]|jgi:serine/threonine-protein kinase|nr:serine/threonine-protein kinase [Tepidisphaeraceae bacterium]
MISSSTSGNSGGSSPKSLFGYEVLDFIGEGAGSSIYLVSHPDSHQIYALKHVVRKVEKDERFVDQLQNEYEVGRHISHRGLRKSVDYKINHTLLRKTIDAMLVMELVDGTPLESRLPDTLLETVDAFIQTGEALSHLHQLGYVHCDLKPNNILRDASGEVKVIDLGQACKVGTKKERIQGTPDYIAPEQVKCQEVTPKTDVFNFGATMYWCVCGKKMPTLFTLSKGENSFLIDSEIPSPRQNNPMVPEALSNLIMDCVKNSASKRPEMADCIRRLELVKHVMQRSSQPANLASDDSRFAGAGAR